MITVPTVLILGAGASAHLGYPTGTGLIQGILKALEKLDTAQMSLFKKLSDPEQALAFKEALKFSGRTSVDAFLEHRPEYIEVGKLAIAQQLLQQERQESLFRPHDDDWYQYLYSHLNASFDAFGENRLSAVTFNYDRSLEHYLFTALKNSYGKTDEEVSSQLSKIPIVHVHGVLGKLPWQDLDSGREYEKTDQEANIKRSAEGIKIIYEGIEGDSEFSKAHELIVRAKRLLFLGFGFHETNMNRLKINWEQGRLFKGTGYGLTQMERGQIESRNSNRLSLYDRQVLGFLRETVDLSG